jgi:hypothetical protein
VRRAAVNRRQGPRNGCPRQRPIASLLGRPSAVPPWRPSPQRARGARRVRARSHPRQRRHACAVGRAEQLWQVEPAPRARRLQDGAQRVKPGRLELGARQRQRQGVVHHAAVHEAAGDFGAQRCGARHRRQHLCCRLGAPRAPAAEGQPDGG